MANFYNERIVEFMKLNMLKDFEIEHYKNKLQDDKLLKYDKNELKKLHKSHIIK